MRNSVVNLVRCPVCGGLLHVDERFLPTRLARTLVGDDDLVEGILHCEKCEVDYPIVAGVAILVANPLTYVANNYAKIMSRAGQYVSPQLRSFFEKRSLHLIGEESGESSWESLRGMSLYAFAHYENLYDYLPPGNPLKAVMGADYGDWYSRFLSVGSDYYTGAKRALDVASNVGGLVYRLASLVPEVYGVDYTFTSVFTARAILIGQPFLQNKYALHIEGTIFEDRTLSITYPKNIEMVVASIHQLPFEKESFDVVTAANVVDVIPDPEQTFDKVYAALDKQGVFLLTDPYFWHTNHAALEQWPGGKVQMRSAEAVREMMGRLFRVVREEDYVIWVLRVYERHYSVYLNHHILGQKV